MSAAALARFTAREGTPADAIVGQRPKLVFSPESADEAAALVAATAQERMAITFVGGGTKLELGAPPERLDAVVRTERLSKVIEYAPSDQVVVVEAGITFAALQREVGAFGQRLALDPPWPDRSTLGGIVAANAFGALRTRYGSVRDLIIGVSFVRADGISARAGGKVVKNVAGFDLPKLLVGSLGTLGLITTVTFRLHPLPETTVTLVLDRLTSSEVRALCAELHAAQLEPAAVVAIWSNAGFTVAVRFEGFRAGVEEQKNRLTALVPRGACEALDDAQAAGVWAEHDRLRTAGSFRAKLAALPAGVEALMAEGIAPFLETLDGPALVLYPTLGLGFISGATADHERLALAIGAARHWLEYLGGSLVIEAASPELRAVCDVWGPAPRALSLMQSVKSRLDPERRLAPGRFAGGI